MNCGRVEQRHVDFSAARVHRSEEGSIDLKVKWPWIWNDVQVLLQSATAEPELQHESVLSQVAHEEQHSVPVVQKVVQTEGPFREG